MKCRLFSDVLQLGEKTSYTTLVDFYELLFLQTSVQEHACNCCRSLFLAQVLNKITYLSERLVQFNLNI